MKKVILIVVVLLAVAIVGGGIYLYTHRDQLVDKIMEKSLASLQTTVINSLQTEEQKAEVNVVFRQLGEKIREGTIDKEELQDLGNLLQKSFADKKLDENETELIVQKLKLMVGEKEGENTE